MCGFFGEIGNDLISKTDFTVLLDLSINRGPDQQGYWADDYCQLGFNRLSILDVSENGKQPLLSPKGKYAIVFNGEVYNYKEIQSKYNIQESDLRSTSDTEILAHLIEKVSVEDFSKELNGMFAIVIYDLSSKKVHLIRDFAGIKPLFYGVHDNGIVFASQFDQIFKHPAFLEKELRPEIMKEYFALGYMHAPNTVFKNIFQVKPSQIITWDQNILQIENQSIYWEWKTTSAINEKSDNSVQAFESIFQEVIKQQLNSDVSIATFLSGGIDSPLVTSFAKEEKHEIKAFTIGVEDPKLNEAEFAKKYAQQIGVEQTVDILSEPQLLNILDQHFLGLREPFGDYSSLPTYLITQKAKKYATVMLSGDGGDELFWGYPRFIKSTEQAKWFKVPLWMRKIFIPIFRKMNKKLSSALDVERVFGDWILYKQIHLETNMLMPNAIFSNELKDDYNFNKSINKSNVLLYLKQNEFEAHLQKVLKKVDLMSMANSIEVRVPFLDKKIIEFSNTIKPELTSTHYETKHILKKALSKKVSSDLIQLPKRGFSVPIEKWLHGELREDVINELLNKPFYGEENIDKNELSKIVNDFFNKKNVNAWGIWHLYAWQKWSKNI